MEFLELLPAPYALPHLWNEKSLVLGLLGLCVPQLRVVQSVRWLSHTLPLREQLHIRQEQEQVSVEITNLQ